MRVGLDLDGVIFNFVESAVKWLNAEVGKVLWDPTIDAVEWDQFEKVFGTEAWDKMWQTEHIVQVFAEAKPFFGARQFVADLMKWHDVRVITSRPPSVRNLTIRRWLEEFTTCTSFYFPSFIDAKGELACDVYIDDHPKMERFAMIWNKPIILFDHPYNRNVSHPLIHRVKDYVGVKNRLAELERRTGRDA